MKMIKALLFLMLLCTTAEASLVTIPTTWKPGDTVTDVKLNNINNAFANVINGGLDNLNMASGYRLLETQASLPASGTQGRVVFNTADNSLNIDNGATWQPVVAPSGTAATGKIPYYNSGWSLLTPGAQYLPLVSNGATSLPTYQTLSTHAGGTGQDFSATAQGSIPYFSASGTLSALAPGTSGQILQTQGASANPQWTNASPYQLISTTSISAATNSGDIAITAGNFYFVMIDITTYAATSNKDSLLFRLNNDANSHYGWVARGFNNAATATNGNAADNADTSIHLNTDDLIGAGTSSSVKFMFYIMPPSPSSAKTIMIKGSSMGVSFATSAYGYQDYFGDWQGSADATSFRVLTNSGGNMTGNVYLYKISKV